MKTIDRIIHFSALDRIQENQYRWHWRYFAPWEVVSKGNGSLLIVPDFLDLMDELRTRYGRPLRVNSWYRDPDYNAQVSSTGQSGPHTTGCAVDLQVVGADAFQVLRLAQGLGFTGVGVKQHGTAGSRFLHLDKLELAGPVTAPRPWVWSYP